MARDARWDDPREMPGEPLRFAPGHAALPARLEDDETPHLRAFATRPRGQTDLQRQTENRSPERVVERLNRTSPIPSIVHS